MERKEVSAEQKARAEELHRKHYIDELEYLRQLGYSDPHAEVARRQTAHLDSLFRPMKAEILREAKYTKGGYRART